MAKTKKMTLKYWNALSDGSKKRALQYCFPIHPAIVEMLMNEKPDLKSDWWQMVFKKVRIPAPRKLLQDSSKQHLFKLNNYDTERTTTITRAEMGTERRVRCS